MIRGQDELFSVDDVGGRVEVPEPARVVKCRRCPSVLRSAESIAAGMGKTCAQHEAAERLWAMRQRKDRRRALQGGRA